MFDYMISNEQFKLLIEQLKLSSGLKQSEIAEMLSVKSTYLSDMINGRVPITEKMLKKISEKFQINNFGSKNITAGIINHSTIDNRSYYSDSPDVLRAEIDRLDQIIETKEGIIKSQEERIKSQEERIKSQEERIKSQEERIKSQEERIDKLLDIIAKK